VTLHVLNLPSVLGRSFFFVGSGPGSIEKASETLRVVSIYFTDEGAAEEQ
jgi:hypothetical protein